MKFLHHPGTPCTRQIQNKKVVVNNLGKNVEAVRCSEGWAILGNNNYWVDDFEFADLKNQVNFGIFDIKCPEDFHGWGFGSPISIEVELTRDCNQNCIHCHNDSGNGPSLNYSALEDFLYEFRQGGGQKLSLTGGEPLLYVQFREVILKARKLGVKNIEITSNGSMIDDSSADFIAEYIDKINISLHGGDSATHNLIVGVDTFLDTCQGISKLVERDVLTQINYSVMNENFNSLEPVFEVARKLSVSRLRFNLVSLKGRGKSLERISREDISKIRKDIKTISQKCGVGLVRSELYPEGYSEGIEYAKFYGCSALKSSLYLDAHGNFLPCSLSDLVLGNLYENSLSEVWNGNLAKQIRKIECKDNCGLICGGRCNLSTFGLLKKQESI